MISNRLTNWLAQIIFEIQTTKEDVNKMNLLLYMIAAAVLGWMATVIMPDNSSLLINVTLAVVGAFLAGTFISPILHIGSINAAFTIPMLLLTLLGAIVPLAIVNFFQGRRMQTT